MSPRTMQIPGVSLAFYLIGLVIATSINSSNGANEPAFRFDGFPAPARRPTELEPNASSLVWQPLRATFRPLNRQSAPLPPLPPPPPAPPTPPVEPLALASENSGAESLAAAAAARDDTDDSEDDRPTRAPMSRFRPTTRAPPVDEQAQPTPSAAAASGSHQQANSSNFHISADCFECICEASTNCNPNSRCQTSDVRHTRCGLFLVSYDQWLEAGLSRELVTREALASDPAADERAFYECVTSRDCAERLLAIYMQKRAFDCDRDGRLDCYDIAAIHQGGLGQCNGQSLLESQYWSDFSACFGFGR